MFWAFGDTVSDIIAKVSEWFTDLNGLIANVTKFDERFLTFYANSIEPISEWLKITGLIALAIIVIAGVFALLKKFFKLTVIIAAILVIFMVVSYFRG